jgi:hypothetical protein
METPRGSDELTSGADACPYSIHDERHEGTPHAFDPREVAKVGARSRQWTAIGATEVEVLVEMARCLREINAGRAPR